MHSGKVSVEVLEQLEVAVAAPSFLRTLSDCLPHPLGKEKLRRPMQQQPGQAGLDMQEHLQVHSPSPTSSTSSASRAAPPRLADEEVTEEDGLLVVPGQCPSSSGGGGNAGAGAGGRHTSSAGTAAAAAAAADGGFELVEVDDAMEALAHYLAVCIAESPEAQNLTPAQLQAALRVTLQSMKKSRFQRVCTVGRAAYRWGALSYSALQMWQNPWLVRAVCTAVYAVGRVAVCRLL